MSPPARITSHRRLVATGLLASLLGLAATGLVTAPAGADVSPPGDRGVDGVVELERPDAARDRGSVEGELAPDGELRRAWVRRHRDEGSGTGERLEEIDEDRVPIAVRVQYELDGESVRADDLRGATGQAVVRIQLRNPTTAPRTVDLSDGERELDVSLPMVAEGLLELDDTWRKVRVDSGRVAPAPGGGTRLRWSSALFEPVAPPTAQIEVSADVDGATLPHLEIEAIPATGTDDLLRLLRDRAAETGTGDAVAAFIADQLGDGLSGAADGAQDLAGGLEQTTDGAGELNTAIEDMRSQVEGGFEELEEGLGQLDAGLERIADALAQVEDGLTEIETGVADLRDGLSGARGGARTLADDVAAPSEAAVRDAWDVLAEQFSVGRADPAYVDALMTVGELHALLTGEVPPEPEQGAGDPGGGDEEELRALTARIAEQTDGDGPGSPPGGGSDAMDGAGAALEDYPGLTASLEELAGGIGEAVGGADRLTDAVGEAAHGVGEIRDGVERLRSMLAEAGGPGPAMGDGDDGEMDRALGRFAGALGELASGGDELAGGLRRLEDGGGELVERLESSLDEANLDLATVEALAERTAESLDEDDPDAVGGHERYLLVFTEETTSAAPLAALGGLLALGVALEVVRRRVTTT
jgi:hypothetical protein